MYKSIVICLLGLFQETKEAVPTFIVLVMEIWSIKLKKPVPRLVLHNNEHNDSTIWIGLLFDCQPTD